MIKEKYKQMLATIKKQTAMKTIIFGIITLLIISCNEKPEIKFSLSGKTNGFENGTLLFLDHNNKTIDSAIVNNNSFEFNTRLPT